MVTPGCPKGITTVTLATYGGTPEGSHRVIRTGEKRVPLSILLTKATIHLNPLVCPESLGVEKADGRPTDPTMTRTSVSLGPLTVGGRGRARRDLVLTLPSPDVLISSTKQIKTPNYSLPGPRTSRVGIRGFSRKSRRFHYKAREEEK